MHLIYFVPEINYIMSNIETLESQL